MNKPNVLFGLIIGASVVFFFSGLAVSAVARAAGRVVTEVRNQFRTRPGIMDYSERPDYAAVVDICTRDSLRELATPGLLAVMAPIATGFFLGYEALGAYLAGAIATGVLMAVFLSNSGGAWDNAKKLVEDGKYGGKGSEAHAATVIGDTVGDPFKDTAGPSLNPLIKVMNLVSVLVAPSVVRFGVGSDDENAYVRTLVGVVTLAVIVLAVFFSKRRRVGFGPQAAAGGGPQPPAGALVGSAIEDTTAPAGDSLNGTAPAKKAPPAKVATARQTPPRATTPAAPAGMPSVAPAKTTPAKATGAKAPGEASAAKAPARKIAAKAPTKANGLAPAKKAAGTPAKRAPRASASMPPLVPDPDAPRPETDPTD